MAREQQKRATTSLLIHEKSNSNLEERLRVLEETVGKLVNDCTNENEQLEERLGMVETELSLLKLRPTTRASSWVSPQSSFVKLDSLCQSSPGTAPDSEDSRLLLIPDVPVIVDTESPSSGNESLNSHPSRKSPRRLHISHTMSDIEAYGKGEELFVLCT